MARLGLPPVPCGLTLSRAMQGHQAVMAAIANSGNGVHFAVLAGTLAKSILGSHSSDFTGFTA